jgi:hypothetical protein
MMAAETTALEHANDFFVEANAGGDGLVGNGRRRTRDKTGKRE